mgnify:CR=1 FL=1
MGYIVRHLQPGESLLHRTTVHWVVYVPGFVYLALAVAGYAAVKRLMPDQAAITAPVAAALFGLAAVLSWLKAFIRRLSTELAVTDRRVVVLASGGMTHRFFTFRELRNRESSDVKNIISPESLEADRKVLGMFERGDHRAVLDWMPEYRKFGPEGKFGHYLIMLGALGGATCTAKGERFSEYEASVGTGQVHVWFERPAGGWAA